MANKVYSIVASKKGSVHYVDGQFYTSNWYSIFIPLTEENRIAFIELVNKKEEEFGRKLNFLELNQLAGSMN